MSCNKTKTFKTTKSYETFSWFNGKICNTKSLQKVNMLSNRTSENNAIVNKVVNTLHSFKKFSHKATKTSRHIDYPKQHYGNVHVVQAQRSLKRLNSFAEYPYGNCR